IPRRFTAGYEERIRGALEGLREGDTAWTPDERAGLDRGILGTPGHNFLKQVGRYAGGILPLVVEGGAGLASGHLAPMAALGGAGIASRLASTQMAKNAAASLGRTIRAGGQTPMRGPTPNADMLARMLAVGGSQQGPQ
ncbi:MAG: hypothetical protein DLM68_08435, partial [Hyphomicrobiales bacterium]